MRTSSLSTLLWSVCVCVKFHWVREITGNPTASQTFRPRSWCQRARRTRGMHRFMWNWAGRRSLPSWPLSEGNPAKIITVCRLRYPLLIKWLVCLYTPISYTYYKAKLRVVNAYDFNTVSTARVPTLWIRRRRPTTLQTK